MNTGERIKSARKIAGLTQAELSKKAGIAINSLRNYELGKRSPNIEILEKIATALDIDESVLLTRDFAIHNSGQDANFPFALIQEYEEIINDILKSGCLSKECAEKTRNRLPSEKDIHLVFSGLARLGTEASKGSLVSFNFMRLSDSGRKFVNDLIDFLVEHKKDNDNVSK